MLGVVGVLVAWRAFDVVFDPTFVVVVNLIYPGAATSDEETCRFGAADAKIVPRPNAWFVVGFEAALG